MTTAETSSGPVRVLTAVAGAAEAPLVSGLRTQPGVDVVRRCADLPDLLAAAAAGLGQVAVVSADLRGLDGDALDRLRSAGCAVVALADPGDAAAGQRLGRLGVSWTTSDAPAADVAAHVLAAHAAVVQVRTIGGRSLEEPDGSAVPQSPDPTLADPRAALPRPTRAAAHRAADRRDAGDGGPPHPGAIVTVWGPAGAPGRTTVAVGLASELAMSGRSALLVDADTSASSIAQALGLLDEASGLVSACRAADRGMLDALALAELAPLVADRWRVLTGLPRAARWPEIRGGALTAVLTEARSVASWTVVDVAACLEQDEELAYDTAAPRRHAATLAALTASDVVVAVGSADPVGLQRLVRGLQDLAEVTGVRPVVVVNRVRPSAVGPRPATRVRQALERYAGVDDAVLLPHDGPALDAALLAGRSLAEHARSSPVRPGLLDLLQRVERAYEPAQIGEPVVSRLRR